MVPNVSLLIDLRTPVEVAADPILSGRVMGIPVPLPPLTPQQLHIMRQQLLTFVPHAIRVGLVCAKGIRSGIAYRMLRAAGYNVVNLGGLQDSATRATLCRLGYWVTGCAA